MERRSDTEQIAQFLSNLEQRLERGELASGLWPRTPRFLFHLTQLDNAISILREGTLHSRAECVRRGLPVVENASPAIIDLTPSWAKERVRLYFRPKTPTFFRNEGFRPEGQRWEGAHMPLPVAFLFDAVSILGRGDARFSETNLARADVRVGAGALQLSRLPFELIYHTEPYGEGENTHAITGHRQAEVILEQSLSLTEHLALLGVRSAAEFETLRTALRTRLGAQAEPWLRSVQVDRAGWWFFRKWAFVEQVDRDASEMLIRFASRPETGPFNIRWEFRTREDVVDDRALDSAAGLYRFRIPTEMRGESFRFRLWLDNELAYDNTFEASWSSVLVRSR